MRNPLYLMIVVLIPYFSCEKNEDTIKPREKITITKTTSEIIAADNAFGLELFQKVVANDKEADNIFISPTSVALALAMTYNGAEGETKTAMENTLKKNGFTIDEINDSYKSLIDALVSVDPKVLLEIANSIWYRQEFSVLPEFISVNQEYYDAEVSPLDFNLPAAPDVINNWVADKTHEKITQIINEIPGDAVMYLINAIYFKGIWLYEFDEDYTDNDLFYLKGGTSITVPFMQQEVTTRYATNALFSMIEMPYGEGNYNMIIMLPHEGNTAEDIVALLTPENWDGWIGALTEQNVRILLPKFKFEYKNKLNDELDAMGMGVAFSDQADFSKINPEEDLFISKVLHKSFVEVNEEGTEAAAVTAVEISLTSVEPEPDYTIFKADRPFLFAIRENDTGAIVFIGSLQNPLSGSNS